MVEQCSTCENSPKYKCSKSEAKRSQIVSFGLACWTLAFPLLVTMAARWLDWSRVEDDAALLHGALQVAHGLYVPVAGWTTKKTAQWMHGIMILIRDRKLTLSPAR